MLSIATYARKDNVILNVCILIVAARHQHTEKLKSETGQVYSDEDKNRD
jgi:hypothetical protein